LPTRAVDRVDRQHDVVVENVVNVEFCRHPDTAQLESLVRPVERPGSRGRT
jgi:hypothetical protein